MESVSIASRGTTIRRGHQHETNLDLADRLCRPCDCSPGLSVEIKRTERDTRGWTCHRKGQESVTSDISSRSVVWLLALQQIGLPFERHEPTQFIPRIAKFPKLPRTPVTASKNILPPTFQKASIQLPGPTLVPPNGISSIGKGAISDVSTRRSQRATTAQALIRPPHRRLPRQRQALPWTQNRPWSVSLRRQQSKSWSRQRSIRAPPPRIRSRFPPRPPNDPRWLSPAK